MLAKVLTGMEVVLIIVTPVNPIGGRSIGRALPKHIYITQHINAEK